MTANPDYIFRHVCIHIYSLEPYMYIYISPATPLPAVGTAGDELLEDDDKHQEGGAEGAEGSDEDAGE